MKIEQLEGEKDEDEESLIFENEDDYSSDSSLFHYPNSHEIEEIPSPGWLSPSYFQPLHRDDEDEICIVGPARTGGTTKVVPFRGPSLISSMLSFFRKPPHQQIPLVIPPRRLQEIVIQMCLRQSSKKRAAMITAIKDPGVSSVSLSFRREGTVTMTIVGEGIDPIALVCVFRKKLYSSVKIISVGPY